MQQKVRQILGPGPSAEAGPAGIKKIADAILGARLWRETFAAEAAKDAKAQQKRKAELKAIAVTRRVYHDELRAAEMIPLQGRPPWDDRLKALRDDVAALDNLTPLMPKRKLSNARKAQLEDLLTMANLWISVFEPVIPGKIYQPSARFSADSAATRAIGEFLIEAGFDSMAPRAIAAQLDRHRQKLRRRRAAGPAGVFDSQTPHLRGPLDL
jgi:hypothetical protein